MMKWILAAAWSAASKDWRNAVIVGLIIAVGLLSVMVAFQLGARRQLREKRQELRQLKSDYDDLQKQLKHSARRLATTQKQLDRTQTALRDCRLRREVAEKRRDEFKAKIARFGHRQIDTSAAVRVHHGTAGGSGTVVWSDGSEMLTLTNAHVAGTKLGSTSTLETFTATGPQKVESRLVFAAYDSRKSVDFAVLRSPAIPGIVPVPISRAVNLTPGVYVTGGSPKFQPTSWRFAYPLESHKPRRRTYRWMPKAISGQSGSGMLIYEDGHPAAIDALLTWADSGGVGQAAWSVSKILLSGDMPTTATPAPGIPATDNPTPCATGIFQEAATWPSDMFSPPLDAPWTQPQLPPPNEATPTPPPTCLPGSGKKPDRG